LEKLLKTGTTVERIGADGIYARGGLIEWVRETLKAVWEIVSKPADQVGFAVLPRRWVVERTCAWLGRSRRLSKDYERSTSSREGMIDAASIRTLRRRLASASGS